MSSAHIPPLKFGLSRAIQVDSEDLRTRHPQMKIELDLVEDEGLLPEETCHALYRVYAGCMENILRHAQAGLVQVHYFPAGSQMILEICDNGKGFLLPADWTEFTRKGQMGLAMMRQRVRAVGGEFTVRSEPGKGVIVQAKTPLRQA